MNEKLLRDCRACGHRVALSAQGCPQCGALRPATFESRFYRENSVLLVLKIVRFVGTGVVWVLLTSFLLSNC